MGKKPENEQRKNSRQCIGMLCVIHLLVFLLGMAAAEEDPVIVRVGDITYTRSQIKPALQTDINLSQMVTGIWLTEEEGSGKKTRNPGCS